MSSEDSSDFDDETLGTEEKGKSLYSRSQVSDLLMEFKLSDLKSGDFAKLNDLYESGNLKPNDLQRFWELASEDIYKIDKPSSDEEERRREIVEVIDINPRERINCVFNMIKHFFYEKGTYEDLKKIELNSGVCGRVFAPGESTYNCRDCSLDSTCVLCVQCFQNSKHTNHRYKMSSSSGGGCCDCGDNEAWKEHPSCTKHQDKIDEDNPDLPPPESAEVAKEYMKFSDLDKLKPKTLDRVTFMIKSILNFTLDILYFPIRLNLVPVKNSPGNMYCVVVYNDESHTFDQVANAVSRALALPVQRVMKLVQQIDRQGRAIVTKGSVETCNQVLSVMNDSMIRLGLQPLKIFIERSNCILLQHLAVEITECLNSILYDFRAARLICAKQLLINTPDGILIEKLYQRDSKMWKSVRAAFHSLLFKSLLTEYSTKLLFAKSFTDNYSLTMEGFIKDEHDHSVSITAISVQLYTVPSICLHIIYNNDAMFKLINTFFREAEKLRFPQSQTNTIQMDGRQIHQPMLLQRFKRAFYILYDIGYLLGYKPAVWTPELRKRFLHGFEKYLDLLALMQGMDPITRCRDEHIEFEQEWETAFHTVQHMSPVTSKMHEWCGSDKELLIKSMRLLLRRLEASGPGEVASVKLYSYGARCVQYDIATNPVSVHCPLTRLYAALFTYTTLQDSGVPAICDILSLIEPTFRYVTLVAEVRSNKWRRNGVGLANQIHWYCCNRARKEVLDRDIIMLQTAATYLSPNSFIINLLYKFGLHQWASEKYNSKMENENISQTMNMVEECLFTLINILFERYVRGIGKVTYEDILQHEIVQQLCIRSMTHSELMQGLYKDFSQETNVENIVVKVAALRERVKGKRTYFLLPGVEKEFNLFYYHYSREDHSEAESNILKSKTAANEFACCPPPLPPEYMYPYTKVLRILHSEVLLQLFLVTIKRAQNKYFSFITETQIQQIFYIMGLALLEDERIILKGDYLKDIDESQDPLAEYDQPKFLEWCERHNIAVEMEKLTHKPIPEVKGLVQYISWFLNEYKRISQLREGSTVSTDTENAGASGVQMDLEVQPTTSNAQQEEESRAVKAARRKAEALKQMQAMQASFMKENASLLADVEDTEKPNKSKSSGNTTNLINKKPVAVGFGKTKAEKEESDFTCILCQETDNIETKIGTIVMTCYVQMSTVIETVEKGEEANIIPLKQDYLECSAEEKDYPINPNAKAPHKMKYFIPGYNISPGPHAQSCGHYMHLACFDKYYNTTVTRESRRTLLRRSAPAFDIERQEYMCPLCNNLCNCVLPIIVKPDEISNECQQDITTEHFIYKLESYFKNLNSKDKDHAKETTEIRKMFPKGRTRACSVIPDLIWKKIDIFSEHCRNLSKQMLPLNGCNCCYSRSGCLIHTLTYTIRSLEISLRNKPLFGALTSRQEDLLRALIHTITMFPYKVLKPDYFRKVAEIGLNYLFNPNDYFFKLDPLGALFMIVLYNTYYTNKFKEFKSNDNTPTTHYYLPDCGVKDNKILHVTVLMNIIIIILRLRKNKLSPYKPLLNAYLSECEIRIITDNPEILNRIKEDCRPFLRCAAIFFRYLSGVKPPEELTVVTGDTFEEIMEYLGLPKSLNDLMDNLTMSRIFGAVRIEKLIEYMDSKKPRDSKVANYIPEIGDPLHIKRLFQLPKDYSHLVNQVSGYACEDHMEKVRNPSICLVCGTVVALQSFCCRKKWKEISVGSGMAHAHECGAGIGIFLRVRTCEIVLLCFPNKGCVLGAPYVDKYGERDEGLVRGNPLYLDDGMYNELEQNWLSHTLPQIIGRHLDDEQNTLSINWRMM